ncbi:Methyl-accepting chemotaxis protein McpB [compost metagenome]
MVAAVCVTLIASFIFTLILSRQLTRRVKQLTEATQAIARGNFQPFIPLKSKDELGELASTVQLMAHDLDILSVYNLA